MRPTEVEKAAEAQVAAEILALADRFSAKVKASEYPLDGCTDRMVVPAGTTTFHAASIDLRRLAARYMETP